MGGSTVIMAPAVETSSAFPRSQSTPDLLSLSSLDTPTPSLSLNLPELDVPSFNSDFKLDTSVFLSSASKSTTNLSSPVIRAEQIPDDQAEVESKNKLKHARNRTGSLVERPRWLPNPLGGGGDSQKEEPPRPTTSAVDTLSAEPSHKDELKPLQKNSSTSSFANFARSWRSSRSPSPMGKAADKENKKEEKQKEKQKEKEIKAGRRRSESTSTRLIKTRKGAESTPEQTDASNSIEVPKPAPRGFRASSYFTKKKQKTTALQKLNTNTNIGASADNSCASSATSLAPPASISASSRNSQSTPVDGNTTTTLVDESSNEMSQPQTRDALWSSFKTLEVDFKGFLSKTTAQRIHQIQSQVSPFLRNTMNHDSIKKLFPEDVDRRATILNKWWIAILEMLEGQTPQPLSNADRQTLYDAVTSMMMRPEWRNATPCFQPLSNRSPCEKVRARSNSSGSSMTSSQAAFLEESSEHNVRTLFVTNLVRQMAFVVEKMSLRHATTGLVNFAGRACAYAFFFAPGVSDILIRLWGLSPDLIRRVADAFGLPRRNKGESEDIVALFPPSLSLFGWTTPKGMWDNLKKVPKLPMLVSRIPWTGPWVSRWKGRDSDLFFIFCKYFYILSDQFMPPGLPLLEKSRAPGYALVHAQLLFVVDSTIHRQTGLDGYTQPFLESNGPDTALTLPLPPNNVMRGMSENRLVMLLKEFLSDSSQEVAGARHTFGESFATLMKASTCKTSQFNHSACFTLCDFLEEVLVVYSDFEQPNGDKFLDWTFWFDVCKKIMSSYNTMSEVRLLSLIFGIWDSIAKDPKRKLAICKDWLLSEETFNDFFNHWCPMVRAYYHRLVCWRMCRDDGKHNDVDMQIFILVAKRLKTTWAHYLYIKHTAEAEQRPPPSTAPVMPAPGKRFMIIRQELNIPQPGLFLTFDGVEGVTTNDQIAGNGSDDAPKSDSKKRWSLLGKVLSLGGGGNNSDAEWGDEIPRRDAANGGQTSSAPATKPSNNSKARASEDDTPIYNEPRFIFKFILAWQNQAAPFRDRFLTRPCLPSPAQTRLTPPEESSSPRLPSEGFPSPTRQFSGSTMAGGLISGAKNASPLDSPAEELPGRLSLDLAPSNNDSELSLSEMIEGRNTPTDTAVPFASAGESGWIVEEYNEDIIEPAKPTGLYTKNVVYAGRSLAEWGQVVFECNNFVERRQDEGVTNLCDMEIPILGVEGFRKVGV